MKRILSYFLTAVFLLTGILSILPANYLHAQTAVTDFGDADTGNADADTSATETGKSAGSSETLTVSGATDFGLTCKSAILMEAETGTVLYELNADEQLSPASITKIMTLILIFDALADGKIKLDDMVTTSAYAKSMGGSQVFLEEGEQQTVETMIKCIVIASGNDASVAMAEHLAGSESEFIRQMNERAKGLGMANTNFEDCCGLTDSANHYTTAKDVAIMSRELISKYPQVSEYATIWMENITHVTKQGSKEFGLSNTNKLLKMNTSYKVLGLKTGSTSVAKYCLSAAGEQNGVKLIAVIMAAPDYKVRFSQADTLLKYGFTNCSVYTDAQEETLDDVPLSGGVEYSVPCRYESDFSYISTTGESFDAVRKEVTYHSDLQAPIKAGDAVGKITYYLGEKEIGSVPLVAAEDVKKAGYLDYLKLVLRHFGC